MSSTTEIAGQGRCIDCGGAAGFRVDYRDGSGSVLVCDRHNDRRMDLRRGRAAVSTDLRPVDPALVGLHEAIAAARARRAV